MRFVAIGDTHLFHDDFAARPLPDGDVLLHVGDALRGGELEELEEFAPWWNALPHRRKVFVPGNHDRCFEDDEDAARALLPGTIVLIDELVTLGGLRIWGSPWTPTFFDWAFMRESGAALEEVWAQMPARLDVLVTHGPPFGVLDDTSNPARAEEGHHAGCRALRARVADVRPRVHVFGHIHEARGVHAGDGTCFINATTAECELGAMVFDVERDGEVRVVGERGG